jgi:hypothetical protein
MLWCTGVQFSRDSESFQDKNIPVLSSATKRLVQLGVDELASGEWREGEVLFPL